MAVEKRWIIRDINLNTLEEFEGIADPSFVGRYFNGVKISSVKQLDDVIVEDSKPTEATLVKERIEDLLQQSDWTQLLDSPVDQVAWATYRQALRDIPQQTGFPDNVTWPIPP